MLIPIIIAIAVVILDQVSKLIFYGMSMSLIGDFLWIESSFNTGASFGMLSGKTWLFVAISIPMIGIMLYLIISKKFRDDKFFTISVATILGGTIGNLIDRIFMGGVRDFIYFKSINFAIFNVADIAITVGAVMLVISLLISIFKKDKDKKQIKNIQEEK